MNWTITSEIENMGGINFFLFQEIDKINSVSYQNNALIDQILLKTGNSWIQGYCIPESGDLVVTPSENDHGTVYDVIFTGDYPVPSATMLSKFNNLINRKFILLVKDHSGMTRVLGSAEFPMRFSFSYKTGKKASDRAGVQFTFRSRSLLPPPYLLTDLSEIQAPVLD